MVQFCYLDYRKIRKIKFRLIFFKGPFWGAYIWGGLSAEGNLRFKIDWASLIVGKKFTVLALFYFVFEGNFPSTSPRGGLYLEERFNGGAYTWKGIETVSCRLLQRMPRTEMDWNLKKLGQLFRNLRLCLQKLPKILRLLFSDEICLISSSYL